MRIAVRTPSTIPAKRTLGKTVIPAKAGIHPSFNLGPPTARVVHPEPAPYWQGSP